MTTWSVIHTETSLVAQSYQGSWKRTWFEAVVPAMLPADWVTGIKTQLAAAAPGVIILTANIYAPTGHETDAANTSIYVDVTFGLDPALYPASVSVNPQFWPQLLLLLFAGYGGGSIISSVFGKGSSSGGGSSGGGIGSSISGIMEPIMMIMMLSMLMPMMQNMIPKND